MQSGPRLNIRKDVFSQDLVKSRSHEIGTINCRIALKFDRHIGSTAAEVPVKLQSNRTILNTNLAASRLYEILLKDAFSDIETGPWKRPWCHDMWLIYWCLNITSLRRYYILHRAEPHRDYQSLLDGNRYFLFGPYGPFMQYPIEEVYIIYFGVQITKALRCNNIYDIIRTNRLNDMDIYFAILCKPQMATRMMVWLCPSVHYS